MTKARLEAFSDAVIAILITIMVLEMKTPHGVDLAGRNHHHLFHAARVLLSVHGSGSRLARALGADFKGKVSVVIYVVGIGFAFPHPWVAFAFYALVALIWLCPDRRIEKLLARSYPE